MKYIFLNRFEMEYYFSKDYLYALTQQQPRRITCGRCTNVIKSNDAPAFPPP